MMQTGETKATKVVQEGLGIIAASQSLSAWIDNVLTI